MHKRLKHRAATEGELEIGRLLLAHAESLELERYLKNGWRFCYDFLDMHIIIVKSPKQAASPVITCFEMDPDLFIGGGHTTRYWTLVLAGAGSVTYVDEQLFHKHLLALKMSQYAGH